MAYLRNKLVLQRQGSLAPPAWNGENSSSVRPDAQRLTVASRAGRIPEVVPAIEAVQDAESLASSIRELSSRRASKGALSK
jgi:hypothetical protein